MIFLCELTISSTMHQLARGIPENVQWRFRIHQGFWRVTLEIFLTMVRQNNLIIIFARWSIYLLFSTRKHFRHKWQQILTSVKIQWLHHFTNMGTFLETLKVLVRGTKLSFLHPNFCKSAVRKSGSRTDERTNRLTDRRTNKHNRGSQGFEVLKTKSKFGISWIFTLFTIFLRSSNNIYNRAKVIQQEQ